MAQKTRKMDEPTRVGFVILASLVESGDFHPAGHMWAAVQTITNLDMFNAVLAAYTRTGMVEKRGQFEYRATEKARALPWGKEATPVPANPYA